MVYSCSQILKMHCHRGFLNIFREKNIMPIIHLFKSAIFRFYSCITNIGKMLHSHFINLQRCNCIFVENIIIKQGKLYKTGRKPTPTVHSFLIIQLILLISHSIWIILLMRTTYFSG